MLDFTWTNAGPAEVTSQAKEMVFITTNIQIYIMAALILSGSIPRTRFRINDKNLLDQVCSHPPFKKNGMKP